VLRFACIETRLSHRGLSLPRPADGWHRPKTVFDPNGQLDDLKKALVEQVLYAELDHHLADEEPGNRRNGYGKKTVIADTARSSWRFRVTARPGLIRS